MLLTWEEAQTLTLLVSGGARTSPPVRTEPVARFPLQRVARAVEEHVGRAVATAEWEQRAVAEVPAMAESRREVAISGMGSPHLTR